MKELKLDTKEIKLTLGELFCIIREPTLREVEDYSDKFKGETSNLEEVKNFLIKMGMSEDIFEKMSARNLTDIMSELVPPEKK